MTEPDTVPSGIDVSVPNLARVYDYMLGGKDNFAADREAAGAGAARRPADALAGAGEPAVPDPGHAFLRAGGHPAVHRHRHRAAHPGQRAPGRAASQSRARTWCTRTTTPWWSATARALLAEDRQTTVVHGDLLRPEELLANPRLRELIDLDQPVALLLVALLHFIPEEPGPAAAVARLRDALAPGQLPGHLARGDQPGARSGERAAVRGDAPARPGLRPASWARSGAGLRSRSSSATSS